MGEPLDGIRAVEAAVGVAAPTAGVYLADMGAEVIKIEPPGGDATRSFRGVGNTLAADAPTPWLVAVNRGKKSLELDMGTAEGRRAGHRLLATADIFLTNHREQGLAHMGLDYATLRSINPRLIYAVSSGFGPLGPDAGAAMLDVAVQARGGLCNMIGPADDVPMVAGTVIGDAAAGMLFALGIVTALAARQRTGAGQRVDTSALGAQLFLQAPDIDFSSMTGNYLSRKGRFMPNIAGITGLYPTSDGRGLVLGRIPPADWPPFCDFAGLEALLDHPVWGNAVIRAGVAGFDVDPTELRQLLGRSIGAHTLQDWRAFLETRPDIVYGVAQTYEEVLSDPQVVANGYVVEVDLPDVGPRRLVSNVVGLSDTPGTPKMDVAVNGQHTAEILGELGYSDDEVVLLLGQLDAGYQRLAQKYGYTEDELRSLEVPASQTMEPPDQ